VDKQKLSNAGPVEVFPRFGGAATDGRLKNLNTRLSCCEDEKTARKLYVCVFSTENVDAFVFELASFFLGAKRRFLFVKVVLFARQKHWHHFMLREAFLQFVVDFGNGELKPELFMNVKSRELVQKLVLTVDTALNIGIVTETMRYSP